MWSCDAKTCREKIKKNSSLWRRKKKEDIRSILRDTVAPNKHCLILPRSPSACAGSGEWEEEGNPASGVLLSGISLHPCMLLLRLPLETSFLSAGFSGSCMVSPVGSGVCFPSVQRSQRTPDHVVGLCVGIHKKLTMNDGLQNKMWDWKHHRQVPCIIIGFCARVLVFHLMPPLGSKYLVTFTHWHFTLIARIWEHLEIN